MSGVGQPTPTPLEAAIALDYIMQMSDICETGLDRETMALLVALCERNVNPAALSEVVKYLRKQKAEEAS